MKQGMIVSGRRKSAVSKVRITDGKGKITYNFLELGNLNKFHAFALQEPLEIYKNAMGEDLKFDIEISTFGGGKESQIEAGRLGLAKALVAITKSDKLRKAFLEYDRNLLVADVRRKETYKPGDSKARRRRQKSYR